MEVTAWVSMYHAMNAQDDQRAFSAATLCRIASFAQPHRRLLTRFLLLSVVTAVLAVATRCSPAGSSTQSCSERASTSSSGWRC